MIVTVEKHGPVRVMVFVDSETNNVDVHIHCSDCGDSDFKFQLVHLPAVAASLLDVLRGCSVEVPQAAQTIKVDFDPEKRN